ncbi:MAG: LysE family translocator [Rhodobacterales bacterium]|nr:LysE family translocator [Rhodobacterales bacterium]
MTPESALALAIACLIFMASPGPGVMGLLARALAGGFRASLGFIAGMVLGDLVFLALAIAGMAVVAQAFGGLFTVVRWAAALYLIYLGIQAWRAPPRDPDAAPPKRNGGWGGLVSGLLITLSNPKVILFYIGFLPTFVDLAHITAGDALIVASVVVGVLTTVMLVYAASASRARRLFRSARAQRVMNRVSGTTLIGVGLAVAARD